MANNSRLEEFLRRRARLQRVEEAVRRNIVVGFFDTLYWTRRFRRASKARKPERTDKPPQFTVPEIFVDDITAADRHDVTPPPQSPIDLSPLQHGATGIDITRSTTPPQDAIMRSRSNSIQLTPSQSPTRGSPLPSPHRPTDSSVSMDFPAAGSLNISHPPPSPTGQSSEGVRSRANSNVSAQDMIDVLDNSAWGESIRRSFTLRRPPPGSRQ